MANIVSGKEYASKWALSQCCCGCSLRVGTLAIGWLELISCIIWIISSATGGRAHTVNYIGIGSLVITLLAAICILIGVYKPNITVLWVSVYFQLLIALWGIVMTIVFFVAFLWPIGIVAVIQVLVALYFFLVIRSYAYEVETTGVHPA